MVLAQVLTDRFMPMEAELATRALAELMSFARLNDETLDACLVRFDVLKKPCRSERWHGDDSARHVVALVERAAPEPRHVGQGVHTPGRTTSPK